MLDTSFAELLEKVDLVVGGDHGKGKFRMVLMVLLRTTTKETRKRRYVVGEINCRKDTAHVLKETFLKKQNDALKTLVNGKRFAVYTKADGSLGLNFSSLIPAGAALVINVPTRVFVCGDLAFFATILGRENMSMKWC